MTFSDLLDSFATLDLCVVGDVMLDEYLFGHATRISVEAPVMVVRQESRRCVPGGAANVAMNIAALGASTSVVGVAGDDEAGRALADELARLPVVDGIVYREGRVTTRKTRVVANHSHQVLRIDHETDDPIGEDLELSVTNRVQGTLAGSNGVLLSDYRKGFLTPSVIKSTMAQARAHLIPVFVNVKPESARHYEGAELVSLNRAEASACLGWPVRTLEDAASGAAELRKTLKVHGVVLTLGDEGFVVDHEKGKLGLRPPEIEAYDAAGAGDTTIAALALGMTSRGFSPQVFELAIQVAAKVVRHVGVVAPNAADLAEIRALG